jgi:hypothetical protein
VRHPTWRHDNESSQAKHSGKAAAEAHQASASSTSASYPHKQLLVAAAAKQQGNAALLKEKHLGVEAAWCAR